MYLHVWGGGGCDRHQAPKSRYIPNHWPTIIPDPQDCIMSSGRSLSPLCHPLMSQYLLPWTTKVPNYAERVGKKQEILILWGWNRWRQIWQKTAEITPIKFGENLLFVFPSSSYGTPLCRPDVPVRIRHEFQVHIYRIANQGTEILLFIFLRRCMTHHGSICVICETLMRTRCDNL